MPGPLLCVTVAAPTTAELRRRRDEVADADLVELRLDTARDPSAAGALAERRRPVIVTCRPAWEGGGFTGPEDDRRRLLADALALGAEYVDIEWRAGFDDLIGREDGRRIVLSMHDFAGVPSDLAQQVRTMRSTGAEVVKVAVTPTHLSDCLPLLGLAARTGGRSDLVTIGMGPAGMATRILAARFGSRWSYAGSVRDAGQLDASVLLNGYHFRAVGETTDVYGLASGSVTHSVSPAMHNAAFRAMNIDAVYVPLQATSADDFLTFGRAIGIRGASVTIPHKVSLFDRVDEVDAIARRIGAINTIRVIDGRWLGSNTDADGFLEPLKDRMALSGLRASIIGAGGAARAVAVALASQGSTVRLHARNRAQAEDVARLASADVGPWPPERGTWDLLVNSTPIGMYPRVDATPVPMALLTGPWVYDLVYNPPITRLVREATAAGCRTIGGLDMLVAQAEEQFLRWTGSRPPAGLMRQAALTRLAEFARDENYVV